jgi:hypothetical protein
MGEPAAEESPLVVVSGLPRSGTSMMMQMLAAGGLEVFTDGSRPADADNPRGYLEHDAVRRTPSDPSWIAAARGRVVKVVLPLLRHLPPGVACRVLMMQRPLVEVLASQARMLARRDRLSETGEDAALARDFAAELERFDDWVAGRAGVETLYVDYGATLADPVGTAARVDAFLGGGLDRAAMAAAVEPDLRRVRAGEP